MDIIFLGYDRTQTSLIEFIEGSGHKVTIVKEKISDLSGADLVFSFGFSHLLNKKAIKSAKRPILNLHISYLPFNRGSYPNFWSWIEGTPSGVSIHEIDEGIDTGPVVVSRYAKNLTADMTFRETFLFLSEQIEDLFRENAEDIFSGNYVATVQTDGGTFHVDKDLPSWMTNWDMRISDAVSRYYDPKS